MRAESHEERLLVNDEGRTSQIFAYGPDSVLKVIRPEMPEWLIATEYDIARSVHQIGAPAPEPRALCEHDGRPAIEYERVNGPTLLHLVLASELSPDEAGAILAEVHLDLLSIETPDPVPPGIESLADRMRSKVERIDWLDDDERRVADDIIDTLADGDRLLHGDLHPGNVIMADATGSPVVVDWFDAAIGSAPADLARSMLLMNPELMHPDVSSEPTGLDAPHDTRGSLSGAIRAAYWKAVGGDGLLSADDQRRIDGLIALVRTVEGIRPGPISLQSIWQAALPHP